MCIQPRRKSASGTRLVRGLIVSALKHALAAAGHRASTTVADAALGAFQPEIGGARFGAPCHNDLSECVRTRVVISGTRCPDGGPEPARHRSDGAGRTRASDG